MAEFTSLRDRCLHCGEYVVTPFQAVTIVYDRSDETADRYQWAHPGCGLNVKPYDGKPREALSDYVAPDKMRASLLDEEWGDELRKSSAPAITEKDVAEFVRRLAVNRLGTL